MEIRPVICATCHRRMICTLRRLLEQSIPQIEIALTTLLPPWILRYTVSRALRTYTDDWTAECALAPGDHEEILTQLLDGRGIVATGELRRILSSRCRLYRGPD